MMRIMSVVMIINWHGIEQFLHFLSILHNRFCFSNLFNSFLYLYINDAFFFFFTGVVLNE